MKAGGSRMKRFFAVILVAGLVAGALCAAADDPYFVERQSSTHFEEAVKIPAHFGRLVTVTRAGAGYYLWFESAEGTIRMVVMEKGGKLQKGVLVINR